MMADTVDGEVRGISGRVERMEIREKEHRLPGDGLFVEDFLYNQRIFILRNR